MRPSAIPILLYAVGAVIAIVQRGYEALGHTLQLPAEEHYLASRHALLNQLAVPLGGRSALTRRRSDMSFDNRDQAAQMLARHLHEYRGRHPLVLAIPRGAVPMGKIVADALDGELDVVLVRKLRAPHNPELAIGSIDETGTVYLDPEMRDLWTESYLETEKKIQLQTLQQRRRMYQPVGSPIDAAGRVVIVLDDGIATGSTMIAALRAVRARHPAKLVAATAVASSDTLQRIGREADEVVCLETPAALYAIGYHFRDFSQVSDEDVLAALREARRPRVTD